MQDELVQFKKDISNYVRKIYSLIMEDYGEYLSEDKIQFIKNFNYQDNIVIDKGGKYSKGPGRWEDNKLALSPITFYENTYKRLLDSDIEYLNINEIDNKLNNSANELFSGTELANLVKQKQLSCLDVVKGVVIHEIFHSVITLRNKNEIYRVIFNDKAYDCKGVKGEYLEEGFVEYYARVFANKHDLFMIPSIPYQANITYAKRIEKSIGKNINKLLFRSDYKGLLNYVHKIDGIKEYNKFENDWLTKRIIKRLKIMDDHEKFVEFNEIEELRLL